MEAISSNAYILTTVKKSVYAGGILFFGYTGINQEAFIILGVLMIIDMVTGISKQYILDPQKITSHKWWYGLMKKVFTLVGIFSLAIGMKGVGISNVLFLNSVIGAFIAAQLYSVIQNIYVFQTKKNVTEYDATSTIFNAILSFVKNKIDKGVESIESSSQKS